MKSNHPNQFRYMRKFEKSCNVLTLDDVSENKEFFEIDSIAEISNYLLYCFCIFRYAGKLCQYQN